MLLSLALLGCIPEDPLVANEEAWAIYDETPIALEGEVFDLQGNPISGAAVVIGEGSTTTDNAGRFALELPRRNALVEVQATGFRPLLRSVWLTRTLDVQSTDIRLLMDPDEDDVARLLFGGDVMFGRRFVDVDGTTPRSEPYPNRTDALVSQADAEAGALDVMSRIEPLLQSSDLTSINFESPFVTTPDTPHPDKDFVFYSNPETLPALESVGVDFIGLGNNHVYDFLEDGLIETLDAVDASGIPFAGAGLNAAEAWIPYQVDVRGIPFSYFAATSIDGWRWSDEVSYVAQGSKGGAANLQEVEQMDVNVGFEVDAGRVPIVQVHTGVEYANRPTERVREHVDNAIAAGAAVVIGHHPHTAQGFSDLDGTFVAWSLGNLAFDGLRLETLLGAVVEVDYRTTPYTITPEPEEPEEEDGEEPEEPEEPESYDRYWERAAVYPIYLEDFRPRLMTGPDAAVAIRQMSEFSEGVVIVNDNGVGRIVPEDQVTWNEREVTIPIPPDRIIDLREHILPDESVFAVVADGEIGTVRMGRDIMRHGGFEDYDVDEDAFEAARWDHTGMSVFPCRTARTGVTGMCSMRRDSDLDISLLPFRNRIRVFGDAENEPEKDLTVYGWSKSDKAGRVDMRVEYHASFGETVFGEEIAHVFEPGTNDWIPFASDLNMPLDLVTTNNPELNPRAIRLFFEHQERRERGAGVFALDDLAVIGWAESETVPLELNASNPYEFIRVALPDSTSVTLTLRRPSL